MNHIAAADGGWMWTMTSSNDVQWATNATVTVGSTGCNLVLAELLVWSVGLSASQLTDLSSYVSGKWGPPGGSTPATVVTASIVPASTASLLLRLNTVPFVDTGKLAQTVTVLGTAPTLSTTQVAVGATASAYFASGVYGGLSVGSSSGSGVVLSGAFTIQGWVRLGNAPTTGWYSIVSVCTSTNNPSDGIYIRPCVNAQSDVPPPH